MPLAFLVSGFGRTVVVGLCVVALSAGLYSQVRANGRLRAERDQAIEINAQNLAVIAAEREAAKRINQAVATEAATAEVWRRRYNAIRLEIANAKPDDDAPIAPVLRRVLDRLPESNGNKTFPIPATGAPGESHAVSGRT
jgi:hypothetical protein